MGGGPGGSMQTQIAGAPVPTPAPPVTSNNQAVQQAEQSQAQSNLLKKSVKNTILAGDTGGYLPAKPNMAGQPDPITAYKAKLG
jgi:hypothetical protein